MKNEKQKWLFGGAGLIVGVLVTVLVGSIMNQANSGSSLQGYLQLKPAGPLSNVSVPKANPPLVTVAKASTIGTTMLANGEMTLYKWNVSASPAKNISIKQMAFNIARSGTVSVGHFKLFRDGVNLSFGNGGPVIIEDSLKNPLTYSNMGATNTMYVIWDNGTGIGEDVINAGTTHTYELKATISGVGAQSISPADTYTVTTTLNNDTGNKSGTATIMGSTTGMAKIQNVTSNFVWSDMSATPHSNDLSPGTTTDFYDGSSVTGLSSIGSFTMTATSGRVYAPAVPLK